MSDEIKESITELNKGFEEFKKTYDEKLETVGAEAKADPVLEAKLAKIEADMDKHQEAVDQAFLDLKRRERVVTDETGAVIDMDEKAFKWANTVAKDTRRPHVAEFDADGLAAYKAAFDKFMRTDEKKLSGDELKALSVGNDGDGGYVTHPDLTGRTVAKIFETSPMRAYASTQVISTDSLEGLYDTGEAGSGWVGETESRPTTSTPDFKRWSIPVHELYAQPAATQKILDDGNIDIEGWLATHVSKKFARDESAAFVNGTGVATPRGFLTYPDFATEGVYELGAIEQFDTGANGAFVAAPNGGDILFDAIYGLKAEYRSNATWFMNRATTKTVRKLKDNDGYLWSPGIANGQPAQLAGYSVAPFEDMPDPATGTLSMAFGDMRSAYQIVERMGMRVLRDPYTAKPYVLFYTTKRVGGDVIDFDALKLIRFSA